jgi:hypothetical protein
MSTLRDDVIPTLEKSSLFAGLSRDQIRAAAERFGAQPAKSGSTAS